MFQESNLLSEIRNILVLVVSGLTIVGFPLLITILFKFYDLNLQLLSKQTAKSIKDEIFAIKDLQELEIDLLKTRLENKNLNRVSISLSSLDLSKIYLERKIFNLSDSLIFYVGDSMSKNFFNELKKEFSSNPQDFLDTKILFKRYEESLSKQLKDFSK